MKLGASDFDLLMELYRKAEKARMTPYAYAVHTGNRYAIKLTAVYRAMTENNHNQGILAKHCWGRGHQYVTLTARR